MKFWEALDPRLRGDDEDDDFPSSPPVAVMPAEAGIQGFLAVSGMLDDVRPLRRLEAESVCRHGCIELHAAELQN
jgi:hypothetical protein